MSYDVFLGSSIGGRWYDIIDVGNMTSNVSNMWRLASPDTDGLAGMHGMSARQAEKHLGLAVLRMRADPEAYAVLEPSNGWGSYQGAMDFLSTVLNSCREHPTLALRIDR